MKVMVCLISDQHIPNLLAVHAIKPEPDLLILVVTPDMKRKNAALNFLEALRIGGLSDLLKEDRHKIIPLNEENSIPSAIKVFEDTTSEYPAAEWTVNITGGTKPMSIAAFEFFKERGNATVLYVPINDQSKALNFSGGMPLGLDHKVTVGQFLAGYGFELSKDESKVKKGEGLAEQRFDTAVYLVANHDNTNVKEFLGHLSYISQERNGRRKGLKIQDSDGLYLMDEALLEHLSRLFPSLRVEENLITGNLKDHEVEYLTGGWLEVFLWVLLSRYSDKLGIREVRLGLEVGSKGSSVARPKNEWDVTFMQGQSLCFVECKTGDQSQDKNGGNTLYKVEAIKKQLGAIRVRSHLATTSENVIDKNTGKITEHLATRADLYNCNIIEGERLQSMAQMQITSPDSSELVKLIDRMFKLNPEVHK